MSNPNCTVEPLIRPSDALAMRLKLIDDATISIDAQYYIWEMDASGLLVLDHVFSAADRGVQVRMIIDDLHVRSHHDAKAAIDAHRNISLGTYRSFANGSGAMRQAIEFVNRFDYLDHRMHNKLLVVDGAEAIVGGRNIADGHFGLSAECNLIDFDIRVAGAVVGDFQAVFDRYWESASVAGVRRRRPHAGARQNVAEDLSRHRALVDIALWSASERPDNRFAVPTSHITVVADAPDAGGSNPPNAVIDTLQASIQHATSSVTAITPFFVPTEDNIAWYRDLAGTGTRIRLLTNSLASNEGTISNSGLDRMRRSVIDAGVELYELKPQAAAKPEWDTPPTSSSYLGLHAKLYVVDGGTVFVGSANLDPRSRHINTEMVVRIESETFAAAIENAFLQLVQPRNAWQIELDRNDRIVWSDDTGRTTTQPSRSRAQALTNWIFSHLPISRYI